MMTNSAMMHMAKMIANAPTLAKGASKVKANQHEISPLLVVIGALAEYQTFHD